MTRTRDVIMKGLRPRPKSSSWPPRAATTGRKSAIIEHAWPNWKRSTGRQMLSSFIGIGRRRCACSLSRLCDLLVHIFKELGKAFVQLLHEHVRQRILLIGAKACQCSGHDLSPGLICQARFLIELINDFLVEVYRDILSVHPPENEKMA